MSFPDPDIQSSTGSGNTMTSSITNTICSGEVIRKPYVRGRRRRGGGRATVALSQSHAAQTPSVHDAFNPPPPSSAASTDLLLTSPTQEPLFYPSSVQFLGGYEPYPIAKHDTIILSSSLGPKVDVNADADIDTNKGQEPPDTDKWNSQSRLPVGTASPTITALRAVLLRCPASLADEEKKHDAKAAPESNKVLRAKNKLETIETKLEDAKWEYERAKAEFEAHELTRVTFRAKHRELDEAERELEELCHSRDAESLIIKRGDLRA